MDNNPNKERIIFRPTTTQIQRLKTLQETGRYQTKSELIRHLLNKGLDSLEKELGTKIF